MANTIMRNKAVLALIALVSSFFVFTVSVPPASAGDGSSQLSLPWTTGESWTLLPSLSGTGAHGWDANTPTSSLDFSGGTGAVRAAAGGTVYRNDGSCGSGQGYVRIDHGGGWQTTYYHLKDMPTNLTHGAPVARGDFLGNTGTNAPCGGSAAGAHVHFTVWNFTGTFNFSSAQEKNLFGMDIGGWNVYWDAGQNKLCMKRNSDNLVRCSGQQILNDGSVGSGSTGNPTGSYELAAQIPGGFRVAGWAKDPDTNDPINVHVYLDGASPGSGSPVGGLLASSTRPDVGNHAYDGLIAYSGSGSHSACIWAVNVGQGAPTNLGCKTIVLSHGATGSFDLVQQGPSRVRVAGWAFDRDTANPATLHVYVGSTLAGAITANGTRTDVGAAYPGYGDNHGYDTTVSFNAAGTHNVCVWALNDGTAGDNGSTQLGCRSLTINNDPVGNYEMIAPGNGGIRIGGWGLDRSVDGPAWIHVYVDGAWGGAYQASNARSDIGAAFPGYGDNHGFDVTIPWAAGTHTACAWVVGDNIGGGNFGLGCKTVTR